MSLPKKGEWLDDLDASLFPIVFAIGFAMVLVGLVVSWFAVVAGGALAAPALFLWVRDVKRKGKR